MPSKLKIAKFSPQILMNKLWKTLNTILKKIMQKWLSSKVICSTISLQTNLTLFIGTFLSFKAILNLIQYYKSHLKILDIVLWIDISNRLANGLKKEDTYLRVFLQEWEILLTFLKSQTNINGNGKQLQVWDQIIGSHFTSFLSDYIFMFYVNFIRGLLLQLINFF